MAHLITLHIYKPHFMQFRFPCTFYATLCFPRILRQFSKRSRMKPDSGNSSPRRQNVGEDNSSLDVPHNIKIHSTPALEPKSNGMPAHIQPMQPQSPNPSQHTETRLSPRVPTKKQKTLNNRDQFSADVHGGFSGKKNFRKKNKTLDIERKYKLAESRSMSDSKRKPNPKGKSNCHDDNEARKSEEPFDICLHGEKKDAMFEENSEQNWVEKSVQAKSKPVLGPGIVLFKSYLTISEQVEIVKKCRKLGLGPGGFYQPGYDDGAKLRLKLMCLGKNWDPQTKYNEERRKDGSLPPHIPPEFTLLVKRTLEESNSLLINNMENMIPNMTPDICIVNFYETNGRLGLHQDHDESKESLLKKLPVVSFSVGDSAEFLYGDQRDVKKANNVLLESGDVLIFGGKSRLIFHGVTSIFKNSAPAELLEMLRPGRLNLTFRQY